MPRISAENIAEHVARQQTAVLDAAVRLFAERGFAEVGLGDIAAEVGLARSSIYRYVPDKAHLLVEWYRRAVPATIEAWSAAVAGDDPPVQRLLRWAEVYLAWAASPEHRLVAPLAAAMPSLDPDTRAELAAMHEAMMQVVAGVVAEAGVPAGEVAGTVDLLAGVVLATARSEAGSGPSPAVRRRLDAAVAAIVTPAPG